MLSESRTPWSESEDEVLLELVDKYGEKKWKKISDEFVERIPGSTRTLMQCRERYFNQIRSGINKADWSFREIQLLFDLHKQYANQWARISEHLPGRPQNSIKCFFYTALKRALRRKNKQKHSRCMRTIKSLVRDPTTTDALDMIDYYREAVQPRQEIERLEEWPEVDFFYLFPVYGWMAWWTYCCYPQMLITNRVP